MPWLQFCTNTFVAVDPTTGFHPLAPVVFLIVNSLSDAPLPANSPQFNNDPEKLIPDLNVTGEALKRLSVSVRDGDPETGSIINWKPDPHEIFPDKLMTSVGLGLILKMCQKGGTCTSQNLEVVNSADVIPVGKNRVKPVAVNWVKVDPSPIWMDVESPKTSADRTLAVIIS